MLYSSTSFNDSTTYLYKIYTMAIHVNESMNIFMNAIASTITTKMITFIEVGISSSLEGTDL